MCTLSLTSTSVDTAHGYIGASGSPPTQMRRLRVLGLSLSGNETSKKDWLHFFSPSPIPHFSHHPRPFPIFFGDSVSCSCVAALPSRDVARVSLFVQHQPSFGALSLRSTITPALRALAHFVDPRILCKLHHNGGAIHPRAPSDSVQGEEHLQA